MALRVRDDQTKGLGICLRVMSVWQMRASGKQDGKWLIPDFRNFSRFLEFGIALSLNNPFLIPLSLIPFLFLFID